MRGDAVLLKPIKQNWVCAAKCGATHVTEGVNIITPMHPCPNMRGAIVPFVEEGVHAALRINRREDYVKRDITTNDGDGIPVMSVTTLRDDGEDCMIFAPCATLKAE